MGDAATGLTTVEIVKGLLLITESSSDDLIGRLIHQTTDEIEQGIGRKIIAAEYTDVLDGSSFTELVLKHSPVISILSLTRAGADVSADSFELNSDGGFLVAVSNGIATSWIEGVRNYTVVYTAGYEVIPAGLEGIATDIVGRRTTVATAKKIGVVSQVLPSGGATSYESRDITEAEWAKLRKWGALQ